MEPPDDLIALIRGAGTCYLATTMPDGSPQLTQTWVDTDGEHVLINTVEGDQKARNIQFDPRVALTVSAPSHPSRYYALRGRGVDVSTEGAAAHNRHPRAPLPGDGLSLVRRPRADPPHAHDHGGLHPPDGLS